MNNESNRTTKRLIPAAQWNDFHVWPPRGGLRHLIFYSKTNGFDAVVRRVGRRILIDEEAFFVWVAKQQTAANSLHMDRLGQAREQR